MTSPWQDKALGFLQDYLQIAHEQMVVLERSLQQLRVGIEKVADSVNDLREALGKDEPCASCGPGGTNDVSFDRSLCACGVMHYYCNACGRQTDGCVG